METMIKTMEKPTLSPSCRQVVSYVLCECQGQCCGFWTSLPGPSRRFYRVCDKLQSAIVNPSAINPLNTNFVDYDNPSMSSDDTLARHASNSPNGIGSEGSEVMASHTNGAVDPSLTEDSTSDMSDTESVPGTE